MRKKISSTLLKILRAILIFGLCFLILQPLFNKLSLSLRSESDLYDPSVITVPRELSLANYAIIFEISNFWSAMWNSLWISTLVAVVQVVSCALVGYGFARYQFPLKKFWFACVILIIIVPPQTISSSLYLHFRFFDVFGIIEALTGAPANLHNSVLPYIMMCLGGIGLKSGLYIFLIRQFFRNIPKDMEEAAYIDGCGNFQTFIQIMLPNAKGILSACFLFAFVWQWTDVYYSRIFLAKQNLLAKVLPTLGEGLSTYLTNTKGALAKPNLAYTNAVTASGLLMMIAPLLLIYIVFQKSFVESLSQTGLKM